MGRWRTDTEDWVRAEQQGPDEVADAAFARVFAALPTLQPSPAFVTRTAGAAWEARTRRRQVAGLAAAAAVLAAAAAVVLYAAFGARVGWLLTTAAALASGTLLSLLSAGATVAAWWSATADAGSTIARTIATPYSVAVLIAVELVAAAALYLLHRLLQSDAAVRSPRAFCF